MDVALVADVEDELSLGVSKTRCSAMVSSTTPRFGPRWPPVLATLGDQPLANLFGQTLQLHQSKPLYVRRAT